MPYQGKAKDERMRVWKKAVPYLAGLAMAIIFGLSFLFSKQGLEDLTPLVLLSCRFVTAALVLTALRLLGAVKIDLRGKPVGGVLLLSAFYPLGSFIFETTGLQYTSTSQAGIMVSLVPILVSVLGMLILSERPSRAQWVFIASSVAGVFITMIFAGSQGERGTFTGLTLLLISALGGSVQNVLSRKYSQYFTPVEITYAMIWLGAIFFSFLAAAQGLLSGSLRESYGAVLHSQGALTAVLYLGVFASVAAFFCMNFMLSRLKAANAAVFTNLATVISILAGVMALGEQFRWYQAVGGVFIILGVWGTNYFEVKGGSKE